MELVPNIAFGDLGHSSLAEVVAAGFRAIATGTIAVEQGKGESRLFMRYGAPCGVQLYVGHRPFSYFLVENGLLEPSDSERFLAESQKKHRRLGEILVAHGVMTPDRVIELVTQHHRECFEALCALREGKYELRGWERPPDWTEPVILDPLGAIVSSMATDELFDRRRDILDRIGDVRLRLADDFDDLASRIALAPEEHQALLRLNVPRSLPDFMEALDRDDAEAFVVGTALLGLTDADTSTQVTVPDDLLQPAAEEEIAIDASAFLTPVEQASSPSYSALRPVPDDEDLVVEDASTILTPLPRTIPPSRPSQPWTPDLSAKLDAALRAAAPAFSSSPPPMEDGESSNTLVDMPLDDVGLGPPELYETTPTAPPPPRSKTIRQQAGEFEFEAAGEEEPLELDLQRAPLSLREAMERQAQRPAPSRPPPPAARATPARPGAATPSRPVSTIAAKPPPKPAEEYNPFSVHFRRAASLAPSSMEELDQRLERALRGETTSPVRPARTVPPTPPPAPRVTAAPAPPATPSGAQSILADIADLVGEMPALMVTGPISIEEPSQPRLNSDDELAILAAEEAIRETSGLSDDAVDTVIDDDFPSEPAYEGASAGVDDDVVVEDDITAGLTESPEPSAPQPVAPPTGLGFQVLTPEEEEPSRPESREASGPEIRLTPAPESTPPPRAGEKTPTPISLSQDRAADVRRRLLQRAFKNVAGTVMKETTARHNVRAPDSIAPRPDNADVSLERDLATRLSELPKQDHFARLGISRSAELDEVKEAFLNLAKRYHPDRLSAMGQPHLLPQARELFARIKESYDVLVDPASRARYLSELNSKDGGSKTKLNPEEAKAAFLRGTHYLRKRDFKNAEAEFIRAIDGDPQGEYLAELAWTLLSNPAQRDGSKQEIRDLMTRALKSGSDNDRTHVVAAHVARAEGEHERAEKHFRKALEKNPKNIEAARELRLIEMRRGTEKKATGFFDKLRRSPASK